MTEAAVKEVAAALNARIAELALALHGEPNRDLSSAQQLRFGTHGSLAVEIAGDNAGRWLDHEARQGGDGLGMVKQGRGLANGAALDWARQWLGWPPGQKPRRKASVPRSEGEPIPEAAPPHVDAFPAEALPLEVTDASDRSKSAKKAAEDAKESLNKSWTARPSS